MKNLFDPATFAKPEAVTQITELAQKTPTTAPQIELGFMHFIAQADAVAHGLLAVLLLMSVMTWYLLFRKLLSYSRISTQSRDFLDAYWHAPMLDSIGSYVQKKTSNDPFSNLTRNSIAAIEQYNSRSAPYLSGSIDADAFVTRAMRRSLSLDAARLEYGHTMLASIASSAPFVGLFGTVWGIYHALVNIGMSGSASLEQVAGPVGEALIMTALGLAVAIPAVIIYNIFNRKKRNLLTEVESFAEDLFAFVSTGVRSSAAKG